MKTLRRKPLAVVLLAVASSLLQICWPETGARAADAASPGPQAVVYRVTGLFAPDREPHLRTALKALPGVELLKIDFDYAEATFSFDPAVTCPGTPPDKVMEKFDELLRIGSGQTFGVRPTCTTPRDKLTRVEIGIERIDCVACCAGLYDILNRQDGVEQVAVYLKDGRASALIDPAKTSLEKLEAALREREVTLTKPAPK